MYESFREMPVWNNALHLSGEVFRMTSGLPRSEDYGLCSQLRRASNSVGANIAEGFGRDGTKEKMQFYRISRGSAYEVIHHLIYGVQVKYFERAKVNILIKEYEKMIFDLNKLLRSLMEVGK